MPSKFTHVHVSRDRRIAIGELKNLAGFVMEELSPEHGAQFVAGIAIRMQALAEGKVDPYIATDEDIKGAIKTVLALQQRGRREPPVQ